MACHRAWPFHSAPIASTASLTVFLSGRSKATGESSSPWCAHQAFQSFSKSSVKNVFERRMMQCTAVGGRDRGSNKTQQKFLEPAQEQAEVVASGGEHGVDAVAMPAVEMVAAHPVVVLEMAGHGLDGGAPPHLAADGLGNPADLAADPDLEPIGIVVAAIALVALDAAHRNTADLFEIGNDRTERVAVMRVAAPWRAARIARFWAR
jgi:hypothetical protein